MFLPESIQKHLTHKEHTLDKIGGSGAQVLLFEDRVLKIEPDCNMSANEHNILRWLQGRLPVPEIIEEEFVDGTRYLLMSRMQGEILCSKHILDDQCLLAELVAEGLRSLWSVDVRDCPTNRTLEHKFPEIEAGLKAGTITRETANQPDTYGSEGFASPAQLFEWLLRNRPQEEPVLSHGDFCLPNIFVKDRKVSGFIDWGLAGVADKWVDIDKTLWSMWANTAGFFGGEKRPFDRKYLFDALHMEPDEEKLRYYSLLSELC